MENDFSWDYWIDYNECATTGNFYLFRNPIYLGADGNAYHRYTTTPLPPDSTETPLTMTLPVASGITAYFAGGFGSTMNLYDSLRLKANFDAVSLYEIYFKNVLKWKRIENSQSPAPKHQDEFIFNFLIKHIETEKKHLLDSSNYYLECYDENDHTIKTRIKDYVNGYIDWITKNYEDLLKVSKAKESKLKPDSIPSSILSENKSPILASELSPMQFIIAVEQILSFTYGCFRDQAFPKKRPGFIWLTEALSKKDIEYNYQIFIDPEFFNHSRFKSLVRGLFVDANIKTKALKKILHKCYNASKANHELFLKHLESKQFEDHYEIFLQFACTSGQINYFLDPPKNIEFQYFRNQDLAHFSTVIFNFLKEEIFTVKVDNAIPSLSDKKTHPVVNNEVVTKSHSTHNNTNSETGNTIPVITDDLHKSQAVNLSDLLHGSDIKFIDAIESILDAIHACFLYQAYPDSHDQIFRFLDVKKGQNISFHYIIDNGNQIIDFQTVKEKIMSLLLRTDIDKSSLKVLLKKCHTLALSNIELYEKHIEHKKFYDSKTLFWQFDPKKLKIVHWGNMPESFNPVAFTNRKLVFYSACILDLLDELVYLKDPQPIIKQITPSEGITTENIPPINNDEVNISDFLDKILSPLTITESFALPCIDSEFKLYLIKAINSIIESDTPEVNKNTYHIRNNKAFYSAINIIKSKFNIKTEHILDLIAHSVQIKEKTVRNHLSSYKTK